MQNILLNMSRENKLTNKSDMIEISRHVVLGGDGFIGSHLVKRLAYSGYHVVSFDKEHRVVEPLETVEAVHGDILDSQLLKELIRPGDFIYIFAGLLGTEELYTNTKDAIDINIHGLNNVLQAAVTSGRCRIFYPSTPDIWVNIYSTTKRCAEELCRAYQKGYELDIRILRVWNIYGPNQSLKVRKLIPHFIVNALADMPLDICGDSENKVKLVYVEDIVKFICRFISSDCIIPGIIYDSTNICETVSLMYIAELIKNLCCSQSKIHLSKNRFGEFDNEYSRTYLDATSILQLESRKSLLDGLKETIEYYRDNLEK